MKISTLLLAAVVAAPVVVASPARYHTPKALPVEKQAPRSTDDDIILHAWSWAFDTIAANMGDIAKAGYTYVQTSPANQCYVGEGGGMALFSEPGDSVTGKWYYYYQPTDWKIGNYMLGSRDQFKAMCDSAMKYGVKVLVDVLPNHTAFDTTAVAPAFNQAVGGHDKLYHSNGLEPVRDYNDRLQCTLWASGGLPDVNTENPDFQYYYLQYVNDLINLGARGFRYDTAKHIGLDTDPVDATAERNNFWDVATGVEPVKGLSLLMPDQLYIYGEVLQDRNVPEEGYAKYMDLTASAYGHVLREALEAGNYNAADLKSWHHTQNPDRLVTWVESHDTYCNAHESAGIPDDVIRQGWVFLVARDGGTPLFFSRPAGSTRENYWGNNRVGARGNDEFKHPEVVAANHFRAAMAGEKEQVTTANEGAVVEVARGTKGAALINLSGKTQKVKMETPLPDGEYTDGVHSTTFKVKKGILTGTLAPIASYILM
ncbi:MAG: alpha-amylase [Bacteroidales bacterium]|nr:alpha-amylase [Bacteroidales bacterium]